MNVVSEDRKDGAMYACVVENRVTQSVKREYNRIVPRAGSVSFAGFCVELHIIVGIFDFSL